MSSIPATKPPKALLAPSDNPRPAIPYSKTGFGPLFQPKEPLIARLAKVAARKKEQPITGWFGIQRSKEPDVDVPPECMLYENDFFKFELGKMPKYRDTPHKAVVADSGLKSLESDMEALAVSAFKETQVLAQEQKKVAPKAAKVPVIGHVKGFKAKDVAAGVPKEKKK